MTFPPLSVVDELPRLDELSRDEFRAVVARLRPDLSDEEYSALWDAFMAQKLARLSCAGCA